MVTVSGVQGGASGGADGDGVVWDRGGGGGFLSYRERVAGDGLVSGRPAADVGIGCIDADRLWVDAVRDRYPHGRFGDVDCRLTVGRVSDSLMTVVEGSSRLLGADGRLLGMVDGGRLMALMRYGACGAPWVWSADAADGVAAVLAGSGPGLPVRDAALAVCDASGWGSGGRVVDGVGPSAGVASPGVSAVSAGLWMRVRACGVPWRLLRGSGSALGVALDPYASAGGDGPVDVGAAGRLAAAWEASPSEGDWREAARLAGLASGVGAGAWACSLPGVAAADDPGVRRALLSVMVADVAGVPDPVGEARDAVGLPAGFVAESLRGAGVSAGAGVDGGEGVDGGWLDAASRVLSCAGGPVGGFVVDSDGGWASARWAIEARRYGLPGVPVGGSWLPFWSVLVSGGVWAGDGFRLVASDPPEVLRRAVGSCPSPEALMGLSGRVCARARV